MHSSLHFLDLVKTLGRRLEERTNDRRGFVAAASALLEEIPILSNLDLNPFLDELSETGGVPPQPYGASVLQGGLTLYTATSGEFRIDVIPTEGMTRLRLPAEALGAHGVLHGHVLVTDESFDCDRQIGTRLKLGELSLRQALVAKAGDKLCAAPEGGYRAFFSIDGAALILRVALIEDPSAARRYGEAGIEVSLSSHEREIVWKRVSFFHHLRETGSKHAFDFARALLVGFPLEVAALHFTGMIERLTSAGARAFTPEEWNELVGVFIDASGLSRERAERLARQASASPPIEDLKKTLSRKLAAALFASEKATVARLASELLQTADGVGALHLVLATSFRVGLSPPDLHWRARESYSAPALCVDAPRVPGKPFEADLFFRTLSRLGETLALKWRARGRSLDDFATLALEVLVSESVGISHFDDESVARWLLSPTNSLPTPFTLRDSFGSPALTVWRCPNDDIVIELLFWRHFDTAIHDHAFSGAWTVLQGASLQATYRFENGTKLVSDVWSGELPLHRLNLLGKGEVQAIEPGEKFIHQVVHLGLPTVSLVVRTTKPRAGVIQSSYFPAGVRALYRSASTIWWLNRIGRNALRRLPEACARGILKETVGGHGSFDSELARFDAFFARYAPDHPERDGLRGKLESMVRIF